MVHAALGEGKLLKPRLSLHFDNPDSDMAHLQDKLEMLQSSASERLWYMPQSVI